MARKYKKSNEHPEFARFKYLIEKKKTTIDEFSKKIGCSRNAIYNFFKWDRKKQIQQIFRKLNFFD